MFALRRLLRSTHVPRNNGVVKAWVQEWSGNRVPKWNPSEFQGTKYVVLTMGVPPKNPVGYTYKEIVEIMGSDNAKQFRKWNAGNTIGIDENRCSLSYPVDVRRFLVSVAHDHYEPSPNPVKFAPFT